MSAYLGTFGRLIPIYSNPSMDVSGIPARTFQTTLEGRVKAQVQPVGRRSWSLSSAYASSAEVSALLGFATGEWGNGPFVWVSPTAPVTNLLTPDQASCDPGLIPSTGSVLEGGPVLLPDGWVPRSLLNASPSSLMGFGAADIPIVSGQPLTVSAWVKGAGAAVRLVWLNAAGSQVLAQVSVVTGTASGWTRSFVTGVPPASAVRAQLQVVNASTATRPAATWTERMFAWSAGEGCQKAVVEAVGREALSGSADFRGCRDSNVSFAIREVG